MGLSGAMWLDLYGDRGADSGIAPIEDWECDECGYDGDCRFGEGRIWCPNCGRRAVELEREEDA